MSQTAAIIIFLVIFFGALGIKAISLTATQKANQADGVIASYGDLRMTATTLLEGFGPQVPSHSLAGLTARVEDSGTLNRRITATRLALMGPFALAAKKKQDDREVYLTIEGPDTAILRTIQLQKHPQAGSEARQFAAQVNLRGRQLPRPDINLASDQIAADNAGTSSALTPKLRTEGIRRSGPPTAPDARPAAPSKYDVVLFDSGKRKIQVIKVVRELAPGLGLKHAKDLVEASPAVILQQTTQAHAAAAKSQLEEAGATVMVNSNIDGCNTPSTSVDT